MSLVSNFASLCIYHRGGWKILAEIILGSDWLRQLHQRYRRKLSTSQFFSSSFFLYCERLITVSGDALERLWNINKGPNYEFEVRPLSVEAFLFAGLIMRLPFTC